MAGYDVSAQRLSQTIISQRGKWWAQQCLRARQECWDRCREHRILKHAENRATYVDLQEQLDVLIGKEKEEALITPAMCMSASAVCSDDLEHFQKKYENKDFRSRRNIDLCRGMLTVAPHPLQVPTAKDMGVWSRQEPAMPEWVATIADYRYFLAAQH